MSTIPDNPVRQTGSVRFTFDEASQAWDGKFNCGPGAICAALDLTPDELRPKMGDFFEKGYTNPTLMFEILDRCGANYRRVYRSDKPLEPPNLFPALNKGLVRIQFSGPWTRPGVPMAARYRKTHWCAVRKQSLEIFDINAMCAGGWIPFSEWADELIPWLIREVYPPEADGKWWPTHAIEVLDQV